MTDLRASFRKPFAEQVTAFRLRLGDLRPTAKWDDVWQEGHNTSFMVAGAIKADLLTDLGAAVDKAIAEGTTLEEFRRDFRKIVDARGWHGWTGEGTKTGEAWRTKVIYKTNMRTSYAAGRMAQLVEGNFKFWVYRHGGSLEPREQHLSWNGLTLPPDHPFWSTHAPPNGWGCSCYVVGARSEAGAKRVGGNPNVTLPPDWAKPSPKTGAPDGIDKGWAYAPGASVAATITRLAPKLAALPEKPSVNLIQSWLTSEIFAGWFANPQGSFPLVRLSAADAMKIESEKVIAMISAETAKKQLRNHPELAAIEYAQAQNVVEQATHIVQDGRSLIFVLVEPGANGHVLVVKATQSGKGLFVTSFSRMSANAARRDAAIAKLLAKGD